MHECDRPWQSLTAAELAHSFDRSAAPLIRAVLLNRPTGSAIILTFDHSIADGISSVRAVERAKRIANAAMSFASGGQSTPKHGRSTMPAAERSKRKWRNQSRRYLILFKGKQHSTSPWCTWLNVPFEPQQLPPDWKPPPPPPPTLDDDPPF